MPTHNILISNGMGFFDGPKPRITKKEFKEIRASLYNKGFSSEKLDKIEGIFLGSLIEDRDIDQGIDEKELERCIKWLRENKDLYYLTDEKIDIIETEMKKRI